MTLTGGSQGAGPAVLWGAWSPSDTHQGSSSAPWAGCWCWYWPTRPSPGAWHRAGPVLSAPGGRGAWWSLLAPPSNTRGCLHSEPLR